jgi:hypothetical protein
VSGAKLARLKYQILVQLNNPGGNAMAESPTPAEKICAPYSEEDAVTMKALRAILATTLSEMIWIQERTIAKKAGAKPARREDVVDVGTFYYGPNGTFGVERPDGTAYCDDAQRQVCCNHGCPC